MPGPGCSLQLLGGFELQVGGRACAAGPIESRILALAGIHGSPLSRRYLAATVWPHATPTRAASRLRSALYRLNRLVPSVIRSGAGEGFGLADGVGCDVRELERWARAVVANGGRGEDELVAGGELLPGWHDPWVLLHRERLRQLQLEALEVLTVRCSTSGRHQQAADAGRAAVRLGPLRESARRVLMRALAAAGQHEAVRRQYDEYRAALRRELGLQPSPHLDKVMAALGVMPSRGGDAAVTTGN